MKWDGWQRDEFNNCLSSAAGNTNASWLPPSPTSATPSSQPPLQHPFEPTSLLSLHYPTWHSHVHTTTHTPPPPQIQRYTRERERERERERGILQRLSDCHQPAVCLKVGRLLGGPYTHLQQSPVNFYTAAASSCNFTHTRMHKKSPKPTHHHDDISSSSLNAQDTCMHVLCVKRMH